MGLTIDIGVLADALQNAPEGADSIREEMDSLNSILEQNGFPAHKEPESIPEIQMGGCLSFPYSFLHYLRRAYACFCEGRPLAPVLGDDLTPEDDQLIDAVTVKMGSHLLWHSDCEGYYVPIDFAQPIIDDELPGGMLGSSQRLLSELVEVAPSIEIPLDNEQLSEEQAALLDPEKDENHRFSIERLVWLTLFQAAEASVKHRTAIVFQ